MNPARKPFAVRINPALIKRVKIEAVREEQALSLFVEQLLVDGLRARRARRRGDR